MRYGADIGYYGCCGFQEICTFYSGADSKYASYSGEGPEGLFQDLLNAREPDQLFHIWFKNPTNFDGNIMPDNYEFDELRQYVRTIPGVVHLGEFINPNSQNQVDGYMFRKEQA